MMCYRNLTLIIIVQATLIFGGIRAYDNKDLYEPKIKPSSFQFSDGFILKHKIGPRTLSAIQDHININNPPIQSSNIKKKVNRNQYGIINMLWSFPLKKLSSTSNYYSGHSLFRLPSRLKSIASTSSYIEFYYLDKTEAPLKKIIQNNQQLNDERALQFRGRYRRNMRKEGRDYPILAFLINDPNYKRLPRQSNDIIKPQTPSIALLNYPNLQRFNYTSLLNTIKYENVTENRIVVDSERLSLTMKTVVAIKRGTPDEHSITLNTLTSNGPKLTTVYDKIKFFEMYDNNTPFPNKVNNRVVVSMENISSNNDLNNDRKILLENVDESQDKQHKNNSTQKTKVKEIYFKRNRKDLNAEKRGMHLARFLDVISTKKNDVTNRPLTVTKSDNNNKNMVATWSEYSFMAAYIYEPTQILCDAAAISSHWLVTSGSCLSKRHKDPEGEGRSAYVAYCDDSWWNAERLAYVKYSIVHPRYSDIYTRRRNMYNMGLIQVVISMATCTRWAPVALISHKFIIPPAGSKAYAVGWGLERYNTEYPCRYNTEYGAAKSARNPLMVYESKLFQNSCLNKFTSSETNNKVEDIQNLYCLSSPPYSGKAIHPIYGSMLLIEGKLCGIYLQEQHQSAQYSSIWRLAPWVSKVAREPDDS